MHCMNNRIVAQSASLILFDVLCSDILCCAFGGKDGEYLCVGSADKSISIYRRRTGCDSWHDPHAVGAVVRLQDVHKAGVTCCSFRKSGLLWGAENTEDPAVWLCLGSWDRTAQIIRSVQRLFEGLDDDAAVTSLTAEAVPKLELHTHGILCSTVNPMGSVLCLGSSDKTASLWNVEDILMSPAAGDKSCDTSLMYHLKDVHSSPILCCSFARDGRTLCLGANDATAVLVNVRNGHVMLRLDGLHTGPINCCSFSKKFLYVAGLPRDRQCSCKLSFS